MFILLVFFLKDIFWIGFFIVYTFLYGECKPGLQCGFFFWRRLGWITTGRSPAYPMTWWSYSWRWSSWLKDEDGDDENLFIIMEMIHHHNDHHDDLNNGDDAGDHDDKVWQLSVVPEATCKGHICCIVTTLHSNTKLQYFSLCPCPCKNHTNVNISITRVFVAWLEPFTDDSPKPLF